MGREYESWPVWENPILTALLVPFSILVTACGTLPRDPEKTLERVQREHQVRVGLVENPPWVVRTQGEPAGVEIQFIRSFAQSLGARPEWFWGSEQRHMEALEHFELDVVIAGLDKKTPWSKTVALTRPYFKETIVVGIPPGTQVPDQLKNVKVTVRSGEAAAAYLEEEDAVPLRVAEISKVSGPLAGPDWRLEKMGFQLTRFRLLEKNHVMAVPPGENGWLKCLGDFLQQHRSEIKPLLQASEGQ